MTMQVEELAQNQHRHLLSRERQRPTSDETVRPFVSSLLANFLQQLPRPRQAGKLPPPRMAEDVFFNHVDAYSSDLGEAMVAGVKWSVASTELELDRIFREILRDEREGTVQTRAYIDDLENLVRERFTKRVRQSVERLMTQYAMSFNRAAIELARRAVREGWSEERYLGRLQRLGSQWGLDGVEDYRYAVTFRTMENQAFQAGVFNTFRTFPTSNLYPFLVYMTMKDERVRPNHRCLHGLTMPTHEESWVFYAPPMGWNCRCRLVPMRADRARRGGYFARWQQRANTRIACFNSLGGPDAGFPRDAFISVLAGGLPAGPVFEVQPGPHDAEIEALNDRLRQLDRTDGADYNEARMIEARLRYLNGLYDEEDLAGLQGDLDALIDAYHGNVFLSEEEVDELREKWHSIMGLSGEVDPFETLQELRLLQRGVNSEFTVEVGYFGFDRSDFEDIVYQVVSEREMERVLEEIREEFGIEIDRDTYEKMVEWRLKKAIDEARVGIRVNHELLDDLVKDGRFKSQFESRHSSGTFFNRVRDELERFAFGHSDLDPENRPIYGYLSSDELHRGVSSLESYGDVSVLLKEEVEERTSFVFGDSFRLLDALPETTIDGEGNVPSLSPVNMAEPNITAIDWNAINDPVQGEFVEELYSGYTEAQVYGRVTLNDIEQIVVPARSLENASESTLAAIEALRAQGIEVIVASDTRMMQSRVGVWSRTRRGGGDVWFTLLSEAYEAVTGQPLLLP